jgi:Mycothiol maleylpyruvate isomerase N-terminal domain
MPSDALPTRRQALRILEQGHRSMDELLRRLPRKAMTTPGLGGGDWSPKDLIGHLESWQEYALQALDAWEQGRGPAIDKELWSTSTSEVNRAAVARKAGRSLPEMRRRADRTYAALAARIGAMSDRRWRQPGTPRGRKAVGERLGSYLGGPAGPFRHAEAHLPQLRSFVERHADTSLS